MKTEAFAKVNLTLEVLGKRVDGYHALRSVVVPVSLSDSLDLDVTDDGSISSDTGYADDLCVKAAKVLRARCPGPFGVRIRVEKCIPVGGGLGGGSADAAAVLRTLNRLWGCALALEALAELGAQVGSDVPALVLAQELRAPVLMEGRGERVSPLFAPHAMRRACRLFLVLVNPGVFCSTPEVFRRLNPCPPEGEAVLVRMREALASGAAADVAEAVQNDLEPPACALHPEITEVKAALIGAGARGALMSGSGATVFGIVSDERTAERLAAEMVARGFKAWSARALV